MNDIDINDYDYDLPADRIAQYPAERRDSSQLLVYKEDKISKDTFRNIHKHIPPESLLVFNNTSVVRARILFQKDTGAVIEVLCLDPVVSSDYALSFETKEPVEWKCIVGNLRKWKSGILKLKYISNDNNFYLFAEKVKAIGDICIIKFSWDCNSMTFGEVMETAGHTPLPPYIAREESSDDAHRYQTVYAAVKGSVAAPTAGLHFTWNVLENIRKKGIKSTNLTLHVGAGTFKPVKSSIVQEHEMHSEHFLTDKKTIELLLEHKDKIVSVGTTSVRALESLYWLGVKLIQSNAEISAPLLLRQFEPYELPGQIPVSQSMMALLKYLSERNSDILHATTSIMIVPGYEFRMIRGMITNFHQPRSTLLLLISAWTGNRWKDIYGYALNNNFRFLSYGDCSLLIK